MVCFNLHGNINTLQKGKEKLIISLYATEQKIQDFRNDDTLDYDRISIIMIDVDPHDGVQEEEMFLFLEEKEWQGLVLLDDIGPQWPEIEDFWNRITFPKLDVSDVGHMSGTGAVSFDSKHTLSWI